MLPLNFVVRSIVEDDISSVMALAQQFSLLNLPYDKVAITERVKKSMASFAGEREKEAAGYVFVIEDMDSRQLVGSSQILAKHGTVDEPTYSFEVLKKE